MIGKLLGHTQPQTTARYAHLADDPMHQLNQRVGDAIARAMSGPQVLPDAAE
jgi:integrase